MATNDTCPLSRRLFVTDKKSRMQFLVVTGADLCVYPWNMRNLSREKSTYELTAANGSPIATYGTLMLTLNLGLRREFAWRFQSQ